MKKTTKTEISFGVWAKTIAKARGELKGFIEDARADKKFPMAGNIKLVEKKMVGVKGFDIALKRYNAYMKRGPQKATKKAA